MRIKRRLRMALAAGLVALSCVAPIAAGQAADQSLPNMPQAGMGFGMVRVDTSTLTTEQQQVYEAAKTAYEQTEDALLQELVTAGVLTAEDVQAYQSMRAQREQFQGMSQPPQGDQPPQDGTQPGQLPEGVQRGQFGSAGNVWATVMAATDNATAQAALQSLTQAEAAYQQALTDAGIALQQGFPTRQPGGA